MTKVLAAGAGGVLLGILVTLAVVRSGWMPAASNEAVVRDIADVPQMAEAAAEQHREDDYAGLTTVEQVLALPSGYAQSEALYVLAGRSDSSDVQNLIYEANKIADDIERARMLSVLFFRLTELDPRSALALAQSDQFGSDKQVEVTVWMTWARSDLDEAIFAASVQPTRARQTRAAQSLYFAHGFLGNAKTDRIEAELGIGPDKRTRSRYLYKLADESVEQAIEFINNLEDKEQKAEYMSWLAHHLALQDPDEALSYAGLFNDSMVAERYRYVLRDYVAKENPQAVIERMLAANNRQEQTSENYSAAAAIARADIEQAMRYFEQANSEEDRRVLGSAIVNELVKQDVTHALAWARENDTGRFSRLEMTVLNHMAMTDPERAVAEAQNSPTPSKRQMLVSSVIQSIGRQDPAVALPLLDQIENRQDRMQASESLVSNWISKDPEAAAEWVVRQDFETQNRLARQLAHQLLSTDADTLLRLLPRLDEKVQVSMRPRVAQQLAVNRSPAEAQAFVRQFEGQPGYEQLQTSVIAGVAQTDPYLAKQLADQIADTEARDSAYLQLVQQHSQNDPSAAIGWVSNIREPGVRRTATAQVAYRWYANDPDGAIRWVSNMPAGADRDDSILHMSYQWQQPSRETDALIDSIGDTEKRGQAKIRQAYAVMQTDPGKALELLNDEDISDEQRQQAEARMRQSGFLIR